MWKYSGLVLGMALCFVAGCATLSESKPPQQESPAIVDLARKKLLGAYPDMDAAAAAAIARAPAGFAHYLMAGNYAQYFVTWNLGTNRFASVYGQGDITNLENAKVVIKTFPERANDYGKKP